MAKRIRFISIIIIFVLCHLPFVYAEPVSVRMRVTSFESKTPIPCKVRFEREDGRPVLPQGEYDYRKWFPISGEKTVHIEPGKYVFRARRGIETVPTRQRIEITRDGQLITASIDYWIRMNDLGWWSGDTHVHRPLEVIGDLLQAEDLNIAPVLTHWNDTDMYKNKPQPSSPTVSVDPLHIYSVMNAEHEKQDGSIMIFNLKKFLPVSGYGAWFPDAMSLIENTHKQGAWVEVEKPFWLDTPMWLALGRPHSLGVVNNHFYELDTMNDEAWGRKRDERYSSKPIGLAHYVMDLYYKALNCGFRLAATGGSASGVLDNPLGHNRTYVYLGDDFSYDGWYTALKKGQNFTGNGPMIFATVNGGMPGTVIEKGTELKLDVKAAAMSGITRVEWIADGRILASYRIDPPRREIRIEDRTDSDGIHWLAVRAFETGPEKVVRFAHTSPFYIDGDHPAQAHPEDVQFFIDWLDKHIERVNDVEKIKEPKDRQARIANLEKAKSVYKEMLKKKDSYTKI